MHIEQFRDFCLAKKVVTEHLPFDDFTLVFKVMAKTFTLLDLNSLQKCDQKIILKCEPKKAEDL